MWRFMGSILLFLRVNIMNIYRATYQRVHHAGIVATIIEIIFARLFSPQAV